MAEHNSRKRRHPAELGPPPRWLNCPRKGSLIAEKFLPFKTPLSEVYDAQLKMGLWIDLTNTDRFYDPKVIEQREIRYLKLQCRGHGECPSVDQTELFIRVCHRFLSLNPLHIIGVHCTHGFNRTGFLIASYLVVNLSWSIEAAVRAVAEARPPGIYKADYLRELFKRYGDVDETPPAPPRPSWCDEENEDLDDDGNALGGDGGGDGPVHTRRRREFNKKPTLTLGSSRVPRTQNPTFMEGVPGVVPITTQPKLLQIQRRCQELCEWESSGFPGSQPVSMDRENIKLLKEEYMVSWKADGTRYMMLIDGENEVYFIDRDNCVFQVSGLCFPRRKDRSQHIQETLVDGQWLARRYKARHNVCARVVCREAAYAGHKGATEWQNGLLSAALANYAMENVFNLDESALFYQLLPNRTLVFKGENCTGGKYAKERQSVAFAVNSTGSQKLPLLGSLRN
ncbi:hypothetical protein HPB50_005020 [Hyalomma asiaticum]|uniref:Uncharacterized protein n=1 Tax=Hyalomma asiaticum TaxID=266040 RepID=A0ACB7SL25_HYAAI|nr:hypothetical protein HPB50_005020 [Hyalomma asiaticum]